MFTWTLIEFANLVLASVSALVLLKAKSLDSPVPTASLLPGLENHFGASTRQFFALSCEVSCTNLVETPLELAPQATTKSTNMIYFKYLIKFLSFFT